MGTTTKFSLPYPELADVPNVQADIKALALAADANVSKVYEQTAPPTGIPVGTIWIDTDG